MDWRISATLIRNIAASGRRSLITVVSLQLQNINLLPSERSWSRPIVNMNVLCIMFLHTITFCHFPKTILQKLIDLFKLFGRICFFPVKMFNSEMIKIARIRSGRWGWSGSKCFCCRFSPTSNPPLMPKPNIWKCIFRCRGLSLPEKVTDYLNVTQTLPPKGPHRIPTLITWQVGLTDQYCFQTFVSLDCWFVGSC